MVITINGKDKDLTDAQSLKAAITETLGDCERVVAELNGVIIKKDNWESTSLNDGDTLELVSIVGGG